jgi:hypothetical protein
VVGKSEGKSLLGRPRRRWEHNIRMDLREIGWQYVDWIYLVHGRDQWWVLAKTILNLAVPYK